MDMPTQNLYPVVCPIVNFFVHVFSSADVIYYLNSRGESYVKTKFFKVVIRVLKFNGFSLLCGCVIIFKSIEKKHPLFFEKGQ